jgi:hypothetical protein
MTSQRDSDLMLSSYSATPYSLDPLHATMSEKPSNSRITLHGITMLKNRRPVPEKPNSFIYDGLFSCAELIEQNEDGIGSFRHYVGRNTKLKRDGTYDIHAKVRIASLIAPTASISFPTFRSLGIDLDVT